MGNNSTELMAASELMALRRKAAEQAARLEALESFQSWGSKELPLQGLYRFPLPGSSLTSTQLQELTSALHKQLLEATHSASVLHTELDQETLLCEAQRREISTLERALRSHAAKSGFNGPIPEYIAVRKDMMGRQACVQLQMALENATEREKGLKIAVGLLSGSRLASPESSHYLSSNREDIQRSVRVREDLAEEMADLRQYLGQTKLRSGDIIAVERENAVLLAEYGKLQDFRFRLDRQNRILTQEIAEKSPQKSQFSRFCSENAELKTAISAISAQIENLSRENTDLKCQNHEIIEKLAKLRQTCQRLGAERGDLEAAMEEIGERMRSVQQESLQTRAIQEHLEQKVWGKDKENDKLVLQNRALVAEYENLTQKIDSNQEEINSLSNDRKTAFFANFSASNRVKSELEALSRSEISLQSDLQASILSLESLKAELSALQEATRSLPSALHCEAQLQVSVQDCAAQISLSKAEVGELREAKALLLTQLASSELHYALSRTEIGKLDSV